MQAYDKVCRDIAEFHPNIIATGVAKDAEFLAHYFREKIWVPKPDRLTVMLGQAMVLTGLPELNEDFFGKTRVVTVQHDKMHILLFPMGGGSGAKEMTGIHGLVQEDSCVVVVVVTPPFQQEELVNRILDYASASNLCKV